MKLSLKIRRWTEHGMLCDILLLRQGEGGAVSCVLHGTLTESLAREVAESLNIPTTWKDLDLRCSEKEPDLLPETHEKKQRQMKGFI
jgi:hypothetical protein